MTTTYLINKQGHTAYWEAVEELKIHLAARGMYINTTDYGKISLMDIEEMLGKPKNKPIGIQTKYKTIEPHYLKYIKTFSTPDYSDDDEITDP